MPLRFLLEGSLDEAIGPRTATLAPTEVALIGCRDLDPPEVEYIRRRGIALFASRDAATADHATPAKLEPFFDLAQLL
jgi:arginase family enzyme